MSSGSEQVNPSSAGEQSRAVASSGNEAPTDQAPLSAAPSQDRSPGGANRVVGLTRFIVIVPVIGMFVAAVVMTALACIDMVQIISGLFGPHIELKKELVAFIELADVFLLAIVLYIMSLGLYELFIDDRLQLPAWLEIHSLDDLKEKLVGVVIVVLAVFFLGSVLESKDPGATLALGVGIAAVIVALSYFLGRIGHKE